MSKESAETLQRAGNVRTNALAQWAREYSLVVRTQLLELIEASVSLLRQWEKHRSERLAVKHERAGKRRKWRRVEKLNLSGERLREYPVRRVEIGGI